MKEIDIYRYIESRPEREHLKRINYSFSPYEMAYIIAFNDEIKLEEKCVDLLKLADNYEEKIDEYNGLDPWYIRDNLAKHIRTSVEYSLDLLKMFVDDDGAYKLHFAYLNKKGKRAEHDAQLYSLSSCIEEIKAYTDHVFYISLTKLNLVEPFNDLHVIMNNSFEVIHINDNSEMSISSLIGPGQLEIPSPFTAGDILTFKDGFYEGPLLYVPFADSGDEILNTYGVNKLGKLEPVGITVFEAEYYRPDRNRPDYRKLECISKYLKNKVDFANFIEEYTNNQNFYMSFDEYNNDIFTGWPNYESE